MKKIILLSLLVAVSNAHAFEFIPDRVWGSYSNRSPKVDTSRRDYEVLLGLQNEQYILDGGIEQENDGFYRLAKINIRTDGWRDCLLEGEYLLKEAHDIDSQSLKALYKPFNGWILLDKLSVGFSINYVKWSKPRGLLNLGIRTKNLQFSWETNFQDRVILSYKTGFDIPMGKKFVLNPYRKYEKNNDNRYDQNKIAVSYIIKK